MHNLCVSDILCCCFHNAGEQKIIFYFYSFYLFFTLKSAFKFNGFSYTVFFHFAKTFKSDTWCFNLGRPGSSSTLDFLIGVLTLMSFPTIMLNYLKLFAPTPLLPGFFKFCLRIHYFSYSVTSFMEDPNDLELESLRLKWLPNNRKLSDILNGNAGE